MRHSVADLLALVGFGSGGDRVGYDWGAVEQSIGLGLPLEYKELVEALPAGYFQDFARVIKPGDVGASSDEFLGYYAHRLEDMRHWRQSDPGRFPLPIFPETGGLLPWGVSRKGDLFFWLTDGDDP